MNTINKTEYTRTDKSSSDASSEQKREKRHRRIGWFLFLFFCVSLTSCLIGFVIGRIVTEDRYTGHIVDTITLSPEQSDGAAIGMNVFNLTGRVMYSDGTPYANSLVELRSEPRYTYTDSLGYFIFENVNPGKHVINVVQNGSVQATCTVLVDTNASHTESQVVKLDDGSFLIRISLDVAILKLVLVIDNDGLTPQLYDSSPLGGGEPALPGEIIGGGDEEDQVSPEQPGIPEIPGQPTTPVQPGTPTTPERPGTPTTPEQPGTPTTPDRAPVVDAREQAAGSQIWAQSTSVNIFGEREGNKNTKTINGENVIAPGASGSYPFRLKNIESNVIKYSISLSDTDEIQPFLPLKYRLKTASSYIGGDQWRSAADIQTGIKALKPGAVDYYTLEWKWLTSDDTVDTLIGRQNEGNLYILTIQINAQFE
ncbi:MAG: carboxypeptidase regulatory-like domain-containing protein [Eubacteriales bacterium]|nr:carboxypeptidase regulatory-like domain-containing protein [Eubacteriales bacterium]